MENTPNEQELPNVDDNEIINANLDPKELSERAGDVFLNASISDVIDDESELGFKEESERGWKELAEAAKNPKKTTPDAYLELGALLGTTSGAPRQMTNAIMSSDRKSLDTILSPSTNPSQDALFIVQTWSSERGRSLTSTTQKALINALLSNPSLPTEAFDYILLGWDLRGEQNVLEVKNAMDAHQTLLNTVLTSQNEFRSSSKGMLSGFQNAANKVLAAAEKMNSKLPPLPTTPATIPGNIGVRTPMTPSSLAGSVINIPQAVKGASTSTGVPSTSGDPKIKTLNNFYRIIGRTEADFHKFLPGKKVNDIMKEFVITIPRDVWERFAAGIGVDAMRNNLNAYLSRHMSK
ncbi:protein 2 [Melampyrum roseum virus 1]|uniref:Protein 2 n=1 Tax=Melampyrum roseum virus 1 TaxID=2793732 RepID=A0A8D9UIQ1_9RHAB|nr:protein 2 [Melampyrum roseum virus 1]DAF42366.1 TPA_asm: protein 2 [Melampyrum roseum virus 1]